jgi:formylglycine-generating enzyme required for sulfatase activity
MRQAEKEKLMQARHPYMVRGAKICRTGRGSFTNLSQSALATLVNGQTPLGINIELYAGVTIKGEIGTVYSIEYVDNFSNSNNIEWRCLEFLRLPAHPYLWVDRSAPAIGQRYYRATVFAAPTNMVFIPPGTFRMGCPPDEPGREIFDGPQTEVTLSRGYLMGKYEVTQDKYRSVMGFNPSGNSGEPNNPVENVTWFMATSYCEELTRRELANGHIPANCVYRLPTEAEWEFACRALTSTMFSYGGDPSYSRLTNYVWYINPDGTTHPVRQKLPNPWGLYDMHGNAWEWCQVNFNFGLPGGIVLDPQGPSIDEGLRVVRSGFWYTLKKERWEFVPSSCRSGARRALSSGVSNFMGGLRVVLAPRRE